MAIRTSRALILLAAIVGACATPGTTEGERAWLGVLMSPGGELPFFLSGREAPEVMHFGVERILLLTPLVAGTAVRFPPYDSWVETHADPTSTVGVLGTWHKVTGGSETTLPFRLLPWSREGEQWGPTFPLAGEQLDVSGRWRVQFDSDPHPAVAIFGPNRSTDAMAPGEIAGTFMTVTGDYRYLAGTARGDEMRLACFDGAHAFLFKAKIQPDGSLKGDFWSSSTWHDTWTAHRDDDAVLPDAFTLTKVKPEVALGDLSYPDVESGKATKLSSLFGKTTLVVLFGTWCPNCGDSGAFLEGLLLRYRERGLRIVGLAFEHGHDSARHARVVRAYRERHGARWPILLAGSSHKEKASAAFPAVDAVRSYPTTLFVDADGIVRAVHQGFAGPATGAAYTAQCESFEKLVQRLLGEAGSVRK